MLIEWFEWLLCGYNSIKEELNEDIEGEIIVLHNEHKYNKYIISNTL